MYENISAAQLSRMIRGREAKPSEVCAFFLSRAKAAEESVHAFITLDFDGAMERAEALDKQPITPETPPLFGLPVAVKDNICAVGMPTTCASKMLEHYHSPFDATVVARVKARQGVIMGKTNMDEFAMGASREKSYFSISRNPLDLSRAPGGSSGGSAAAVAAGSAPLALGSDTGGSIRQPAAFCGVVGYKPSFGAVSRYGLIAYVSGFDQAGPIARTVNDAALLAGAISGHDPRDARSCPSYAPDFSGIEAFGVRGKKIGLLRDCLGDGIQDDVRAAVLSAARAFKAMGAEIIDIRIENMKYALPVYYAIALAEGSSSLARFDGVRYGRRAENTADVDSLYIQSRTQGFGREVKKRIMLGTFILSAGNIDRYYKKARLAQQAIKDDFAQAFGKCDLLMAPTALTTAPKFSEKMSGPAAYLGDVCTVPINIAGLPAISLPCGADGDKLPVGLQLIGKKFEDVQLLGFARAFEREVRP